MVIRRGDVWWCDLPTPTGREPGYERPVVVVQSDRINVTNYGTILVAPITSNLVWGEAEGHVRLKRGMAGLPKDCVVLTSQLMTVDRDMMLERLGRLDEWSVALVDHGLQIVMGLGGSGR